MATGTTPRPKSADKILERIPIAEVLQRLGLDVAALRQASGSRGSRVRFPCPHHGGENNNLEMHLEAEAGFKPGDFKCYACDWKGDFAKFYAERTGVNRAAALAALDSMYGGATALAPEVDRVAVGQHHAVLLANTAALEKLLTAKGITRDTVTRRTIGLEPSGRYTFPIADDAGRVVDVRRYKPDAESGNKMLHAAGHGDITHLYPIDNLTRPSAEFDRSTWHEAIRNLLCRDTPKEEPLILLEGEVKALLCEQYGFRAVAGTGGANTWGQSLSKKLKGRRVYVCYDMDKAGRTAAKSVCAQLQRHCEWVGNVKLPFDGNNKGQKDVTDYFVKGGYNAQDFGNLLLGTEEYTHEGRQNIADPSDPTYDVSLLNAVKAQYNGKRIRTKFLVASKDTSPFIVPMEIRIACDKSCGELCEHCPVMKDKTDRFKLAEADSAILRLVNVQHEKQERILRELHKIPQSCPVARIEREITLNLEHMKLVPSIDISNPEMAEEECSRVGYRVGFGAQPNVCYAGTGFVLPEPQDQSAALLFTEITPTVDSLTEFNAAVKEEELVDLKVFQPQTNSVKHIQAKLNELYKDLSLNVTGIYERDDMHLFMDLCWHSVLYLPGGPFGKHEPERGWCDMLVLGDTRQGKTETANRLRQHYGLGAWAPAKICTRAGLIGNAQQVGTRWHIAWGIVPNNDRQLVVIEEAKGMDKDVITQMTDLRSSGKAMLIMVETATTHARTRLLWLSNPRSDRSLDTYSYGVEAVKELIGAQEDISRFTCIMNVASGEVGDNVLAGDPDKLAKAAHFATTARCRRLVLWAWTRGSQDVEFTKDALQAIRDVTKEHCAQYHAAIPLVEPADYRFKLARLSTALAARLFSCDDSMRKLVVTDGHVRYIGDFLRHIFNKACFAYDTWSKNKKGGQTVRHEPVVRDALINSCAHWPDACRALLSLPEISAGDLEDIFGVDRDKAKGLMAVLTQAQCIERRRNARYRTPSFNRLLKTLVVEGEVAAASGKPLPSGAPPASNAGSEDF